ncbi:uridine kinase [Chthonomonas calidirosea]|uniref:uridine kinase family protein n=1 Tax=Chthonomonas calidirosea TaxID=454171 RepID=UPI0006DD398C|nr:hypothetical protein [Chthonomonas calidirosea]CEK15208.1 uridine kinase [Chthonomonas calidirosea]
MKNQTRSVIVGIAGGSASGKTTLVQHLAQALAAGRPPLHAEVIGMDRYFYRGAPGGPTFISPSTGERLPDNNHPNSADNARLIADLETLCASENAPDVILVEGLMALYVPELRERFDLRLFVELDADLRALRRLLRDMQGGRGSTDPHWIATYYRECARVGHAAYVEPSRVHADLIVRGDADFQRIAPYLAAIIRELWSTRRSPHE